MRDSVKPTQIRPTRSPAIVSQERSVARLSLARMWFSLKCPEGGQGRHAAVFCKITAAAGPNFLNPSPNQASSPQTHSLERPFKMPPMSLVGIVTSVGKMAKTATVTVSRNTQHPRTRKVRAYPMSLQRILL